MLDDEGAGKLLEAAREARQRAYAPYSRFTVGAALLDRSGEVHTGVNVENSSYGLSTCAERSAVAGAVGRGAREFEAIAIAGPDDETACPPCGSCRQILHEFAPGLQVVLAGAAGEARILPLSDLLPEAFGPGSMRKEKGS